MKPVIIGCRTENFLPEQLAAFELHQPFGMIVFAEPCKAGPETVKHVVQQFLSVCPHGRIFMDAEGGVVNRLKPSFGHGWRAIPGAREFAELATTDLAKACRAITLNAQLIAHDLSALGINVDCAPVVDLISEDVLSNVDSDGKPHATAASLYKRSFGHDPDIVIACATAFADGLHSMGVASVLKHAPGYGRVAVDPHYGMDAIDATLDEMMASDLLPYIAMKDYPAVMTAHTIYTDIDPDNVATISRKVMTGLLKEKIGFSGLIITDTIEMNSLLEGGYSETEKDQYGMGLPLPGTLARVTIAALNAGCDLVMHSDCSRRFQDTIDMLEAAPELNPTEAQRLLDKMTVQKTQQNFDFAAAEAELAVLLNK